MASFTKISADAFKHLQLDAGMVLNTFDPATGTAPQDSAIVCATTGGITVSCVPSFKDFGEDVDNCPNNMMEYKQIESWEAKLGFTALEVTADVIKLALGAADISSNKITPRKTLGSSDYTSIWWVGDMADGGFAAVKLSNALSTSGLSLTTTKDGKGNIAVELTGHYSSSAQSTVPMEFYVVAGTSNS